MTGPGVPPLPVTLPPLNVNVQNARNDSPLSAVSRQGPGMSPVGHGHGGAGAGQIGTQAPYLPAPTPLSMMVPHQNQTEEAVQMKKEQVVLGGPGTPANGSGPAVQGVKVANS